MKLELQWNKTEHLFHCSIYFFRALVSCAINAAIYFISFIWLFCGQEVRECDSSNIQRIQRFNDKQKSEIFCVDFYSLGTVLLSRLPPSTLRFVYWVWLILLGVCYGNAGIWNQIFSNFAVENLQLIIGIWHTYGCVI